MQNTFPIQEPVKSELIIIAADMHGFNQLVDKTDSLVLYKLMYNLTELSIIEANKVRGKLVKVMGDGLLFVLPLEEVKELINFINSLQINLNKELHKISPDNQFAFCAHVGTVTTGNLNNAFDILGAEVNNTFTMQSKFKSKNSVVISAKLNQLIPDEARKTLNYYVPE